MKLKINQIRRDGGTQPRARILDSIVSDYADDMRSGNDFPPVTVFFDGENYWLADGFHRVYAAEHLKFREIEADVRQGTQRDATLFACGANASHGTRRTNEDKRCAVLRLLEDDEWGKWSDREIARRCAVDGKTVAAIRAELTAEIRSEDSEPAPEPASDEKRLYTRSGVLSTMSVSKIGKSNRAKPDKHTTGIVDTPSIPPKHQPSTSAISKSLGVVSDEEDEDVTAFQIWQDIQEQLDSLSSFSQKRSVIAYLISELTKQLEDNYGKND